jgi:hypothetical protein
MARSHRGTVFDAALTCSRDPSGQMRTRLRLTQTQPVEPFVFTIQVRFKGTVDRLESVPVDGALATADFVSGACYTEVDLDPGHDLFIWRPEYGTATKP